MAVCDEAERAALENRRLGENRRQGQLAKLPGERREELERLAREDRSSAELGLVKLSDDGVYFKHVDDLTPEYLWARAKAEEAQKARLAGRLRRLTGERP
jgi:hypothetical protein